MSGTSDSKGAQRRLVKGYGGPAGDSASKEAVGRLRSELGGLKATQAALPHL